MYVPALDALKFLRLILLTLKRIEVTITELNKLLDPAQPSMQIGYALLNIVMD